MRNIAVTIPSLDSSPQEVSCILGNWNLHKKTVAKMYLDRLTEMYGLWMYTHLVYTFRSSKRVCKLHPFYMLSYCICLKIHSGETLFSGFNKLQVHVMLSLRNITVEFLMILPSARKMIEWWTQWWSHLSILPVNVSIARQLILMSVSYLWIFFIIHHKSCLYCISKHAPLRIRVCITSLPEFECKQHGKHNKYVKYKGQLQCSTLGPLDRSVSCINTHSYADMYY